MAETISISSHLVNIDRESVWHPFTQVQTQDPPIPIVQAQGSYIYSADGKRYIDAISSWWVNLHGHCHPYIANKIKEQAAELEHVLFSGFTHPPAVELARKLLSLLPGKMNKIFYSDNGSTAVEIALKMAFQYWYNKNANTKRTKVICFRNSYHGDTFGAMSAAGKNGFNTPFWKYLFEVRSIDPPIAGSEENSISQLRSILSEGESACFIFEPLVLGSGGMIMYAPSALDSLIRLCQEHNVLTIADEVMTGFGRTGSIFACDKLNLSPDLICLSKGLTGGFLPLGATACQQHIFEAFLGDTLNQAFLHGHSYTANPIACSSALASLELLLQSFCTQQREMIGRCHEDFCKKWKGHSRVKRCESTGTILALEYASNEPNLGNQSSYFHPLRDKLYSFFLEKGILLRPLGNVLYILPPYCIQRDELELIYKHISETLEGSL